MFENYTIEDLIKRYPELEFCKDSILEAYDILETSFSNGHKLLVAGNGGSSADSDHIVGELMKSFKANRKINEEVESLLIGLDEVKGKEIASKLQGALPAINLMNHTGLNTAYTNDVKDGGLYVIAQQVYGYGQKGDVLIAISTSGNSENIYNAALVAKAKGVKVIGLTGQDGGKLSLIADVIIKAPSKETFVIQEYHLPIYHFLCLMLENKFFK